MDSPRFGDRSLAAFVDALSSSAPVPGGGSAAAVAASLAAGLVAMVAALSDRPRYAAHRALHERVAGEARALADEALALADEDAEAYGAYAAAVRKPRDSEDERVARDAAIRAAARGAAEVPLRTVDACRRIASGAESLAGRSNVNASSDLAVAALLAEAAARAAALNVEVNVPSVGDAEWADRTRRNVDALIEEIAGLAASTRDVVASGEARDALDLVPTSPSGA